MVSFNGTLNVEGGGQISYPLYPAGGTVYAADAMGNSGVLISYDGCLPSANVSLCPGNFSFQAPNINRILVTDTDLDLSHGSELNVDSIGLLSTDLFSKFFQEKCSNGSLSIRNATYLNLNSSLSILSFSILLLSGVMNIGGNVTIANGSLIIDPLTAIIQADDILSTYSFSFSNLFVNTFGSMMFLPTSSIYAASVSIFISGILRVEGYMSAAALFINPYDAIYASGLAYNGKFATNFRSAEGGGNAGYGSPGCYQNGGGEARDDAADSGTPGGAGGGTINANGGNGGGGLIISANTLCVKGTLTVSGESGSCMGCGGGAGGSLYINVTVLEGDGNILANGGHGYLSNLSAYNGGGGSGGRIVISTRYSYYTGRIYALGGLSLQPDSCIFGSELEITLSWQQSRLNIVAGAAGIILYYTIGFQNLSLTSWGPSHFEEYYTTPALQVIASVSNIPFPNWKIASIGPTYVFLNDSRIINSRFDSVLLTNPPLILNIFGPGNLSTNQINGKGSEVVFVNGATWNDSSSLLSINGMQLTLSLLMDSYSIKVSDGGRLIWNSNDTLITNNLVVTNNSSLVGQYLDIIASDVSITLNSSITTAGLGYSGSQPWTNKTKGDGPGGGLNGAAGANGGGHAGVGLDGISAIYSAITEDHQLGASGLQIQSTFNESYLSYGNATAPSTPGSGGGSVGSSLYGRGGSGGGVIQIKTHHMYLDLTSSISADGESIFGGGGGGAGGSIWLDGPNLFVEGSGSIHSNGGLTCRTSNCSPTLNFTGGGGGGGYIRVSGDSTNFTGIISTLSGCGESSLDNYVTLTKGYILYERQLVSLILNTSADNRSAFVDVILQLQPLNMVQIIYMTDAFNGSMLSTKNSTIIRGFWKLSFRSLSSSSLPASASALLVQESLKNITGQRHISVVKYPFESGGWVWCVTFHDAVDRVTKLQVDGSELYSTYGNAQIAVNISYPNQLLFSSMEYDQAYATYSTSEVTSLISFNYPILGNSSFGYWLNDTTFRIDIGNSGISLYEMIGKLRITNLFWIHTALGMVNTLNFSTLV